MQKIFIGLMAVLLITFNFTSISNAKEITDEYDSNIAGVGVSLASFISKENESNINEKQEETTNDTKKETSPYENIAITQVNNYVNIRKESSTDSDILGKIYNNSAATILKIVDGEDGKWYYIKSGNVKGYIKSEYFVTGDDAEKIAKKVGNVLCKTTAVTLRLREKPSMDSRTISLLSEDSIYSVLKENVTDKDGNEFIYILVSDSENEDDDIRGYISSDYADVYVEFEEAISIEEEKAELKIKEEESLRENNENNFKSSRHSSTREKSTKKKSDNNKNNQEKQNDSSVDKKDRNEPSERKSGVGNAIAAKAQQYVGWLPYVWGGTSLNSGADCSGFVQSIYSNYGVSVPRTSSSQSSSGKTISYGELQIGDLVFYGSPINHVAIYIGNNQICHEANSRRDCTIDNIFYVTPTKYVTYLH